VEAWGRAAAAEGWWQGAGSEAGPGGVVEGAGYIAGEPMRNDTEPATGFVRFWSGLRNSLIK
jgi:hypothetical protein